MTKTEQKKNLTINYIMIQAGLWALHAPLVGYASVFLLSKNFSNTDVGLISALGCIVSVFLQIMVSGYADKNKNISVKKLLIMAAGVEFILSVILFIIGSCSILAIGIIFGLIMSVLQLLVPLSNSIAMENINRGVKINYGVARGMGSLAFSIIVNIIGIFAKKDDLEIVPVAAIIMTVILIIGTALFPADKGDIIEETVIKSNPKSKPFLLKYPRMALFLLGAVCAYIGHNLINVFLFQIVTLKGGDHVVMGACLSLAAIVEVPLMSGFGYLVAKRDSGFWVKIGSIGIMLKIIFTWLVPNMAGMIPIQILQMPGFALFTVSTVYYANQEIEKCDLVKGQAYMTAVSTLGMIIASVLGGALIDIFSTDIMLVTGSIITIFGTVVTFVSTTKPPVTVAE